MRYIYSKVYFPWLFFYVYIESHNPKKPEGSTPLAPKPHQLKTPSQKTHSRPQPQTTINEQNEKYNFWPKIIFQKEIVWINKLPLKIIQLELSSQVVIALRKTWLNSQSWLAIKLHIMPSCDLLAPNSTQWKAQSVFDWIWLVKIPSAIPLLNHQHWFSLLVK